MVILTTTTRITLIIFLCDFIVLMLDLVTKLGENGSSIKGTVLP